jgi:signal transduction histidine kinase
VGDLGAWLDAFPDPAFAWRDEGVLGANGEAAALLGEASPRDLVGRPWAEWVHPDDRELAATLLHLAQGSPVSGLDEAIRFVRADGEVIDVSVVRASCVPVPGGFAVLSILRRRGAQLGSVRSLLVERMASMSRLVASVSHEINNPLASVVANLDFVRMELDELGHLLPAARVGELDQALHEAQEAAARVARVVRELAALGRGAMHRSAPLDLRPLVEAAVRSMSSELRERARLVLDLGDTPLVTASPALVGQMLLILLQAAHDNVPEGDATRQEIRVACAGSAGVGAVIEVEDSGPPSAHVADGAPLGLFPAQLATCRRIVRDLGGGLAVDGLVGGGTRVRVTLPASQPPPSPVRTPEQAV